MQLKDAKSVLSAWRAVQASAASLFVLLSDVHFSTLISRRFGMIAVQISASTICKLMC
jgi:hypothetical protein